MLRPAANPVKEIRLRRSRLTDADSEGCGFQPFPPYALAVKISPVDGAAVPAVWSEIRPRA